MTSTSFSVGLVDARNSSRVLRPPGGGHTDIFGVSEPPKHKKAPEPAPPVEANVAKNNESETVPIMTVIEENSSSPKKQDASHEKVEEVKPPEQPKVEQPQRRRVPPGGFSSGLW